MPTTDDSKTPGTLQIGEWAVDPQLDIIRRGAVQTKLEPRAMRLLCFLAERPGEVRTFDELLENVWPGIVVSQSSVYQAVAQLRRALGDDGDEARYIASVPRKGYRLVASVGAVLVEPGAATTASSPANIVSKRSGVTAIGVGVAVIAIGVGSWLLLGTRDRVRVAPVAPAVAVLPFADLSAGAQETVFAEGLTDEIITSLGRARGLKVTGRTSVFRVPKETSDPRRLGTLLGVSHVLLGSVRTFEGRVRVSARLVSTADGFQVWSNNYDRARVGAVAVQTDIAKEVADSLQLRLGPEALHELTTPPTTQLNAYDLYLLGRNQQLQRNSEALARAEDYHRQAIAIDPRFALAYAGLADAQMAGFYYSNRSLPDTAKLVEASVQSALAIDPELAEAYAARAVLRMEQWQLDDAIADLKRALSINPNVGEFYLRLGAAYEYAGRPRAALQAYDQVQSLDPLHTQLHVRRCLTLQNLARYTDADRACQRAFELQPEIPGHLWASGLNQYAQGNVRAAIGKYQQALERAPQRADIRAELALLLLDVDEVGRADQEFAGAIAARGDDAVDLQLSRLDVLLAQGDFGALRARLRALQLPQNAGPRLAIEAGYLAATSGDIAAAEKWRVLATQTANFSRDAIYPGIYALRWGLCNVCQLAYLERLAGSSERAREYEGFALGIVDDLEKAGHVWHGLHYVRATILAQRGDRAAALAALQKAAVLGWRRPWLARADPALALLRGSPEFDRLLQQMRPNAVAKR